MSECPNCAANVSSISPTGQEQVLCNLNNEGGLQEGLGILPLLIEAAYLRTYPEERKARAFVEFAGEGDVESMLDMLKGGEDGEEEAGGGDGGQEIDLLRYQDPINGMNSALHVAVINGSITVAWLLLWLASGMNTARFPQEIAAQAQGLGLSRESALGKADIRSLRDSEGMTARQRAADLEGIWTAKPTNGSLFSGLDAYPS